MNRFGAAPQPEQPTVAGVARIEPFGAAIQGRLAHHVDIRVQRQNLVMDAADPVGAKTNLAIGHGMEMFAERRSEFAERLLGGVERNAAHQMQFLVHAPRAPKLTVPGECIARVGGRGALKLVDVELASRYQVGTAAPYDVAG
jgi:hypothetical protein